MKKYHSLKSSAQVNVSKPAAWDFLIEMDQVAPLEAFIVLIEPHYPKGGGGRHVYPLMAMLRVNLMQNWLGYSDPAMEEALYEATILRDFTGLHLNRISDETTILNFHRLVEQNMNRRSGFCRFSTVI